MMNIFASLCLQNLNLGDGTGPRCVCVCGGGWAVAFTGLGYRGKKVTTFILELAVLGSPTAPCC